MRTLFDTGEAYAVSMSPAAVKESGLGPVPAKGTFDIGKIKLMNMAGFEMSDVPVMLLGKEAGFDKSLKEYGAIIGLGIMQNFTVTFDWKANMVTFQR